MYQPTIFIKAAVLSFAAILMSSFVAFRSGAFRIPVDDAIEEHSDTTIPEREDSILLGDSIKPIPKIRSLKNIKIDSSLRKRDTDYGESSKSGRIFSGEDLYIEGIRVLPEKKRKKKAVRQQK